MLLYRGRIYADLRRGRSRYNGNLCRISNDMRHRNTTVLLDRDAPRTFGEWIMGFTRLAKGSDPGVFALTEDATHGRLMPGASAEIVTLLLTFFRVNS